MKILYVTTVAETIGFFPEHIKMLIEDGHSVDIATNSVDSELPQYCIDYKLKVFDIPFSRSPIRKENYQAYKALKKLIADNGYDVIHTHTPNASAIVRFACRKMRSAGLKVIYTAHGFHFFKGAPLPNWLIFYPIEWICAHWTDVLITINQEDYKFAQKHMHAKSVTYVPGVGINLRKYHVRDIDTKKKKAELGVAEDAVVLFSVGELNENKNHKTVIEALSIIKNNRLVYLIAGAGDLEEELRELIINKNLSDKVKLLGYRNDMPELYTMSDIYIHPSFREGLSVALMEAMAMGLPCIVSKIRGNTDLIDENGGALFNPYSVDECKEAIAKICSIDWEVKGKYNADKIKTFSDENVLREMKRIYEM